MQFGIKQLFKPTPIKIKVLGKSIKIAAITAGTIAATAGTSPAISIGLVVAGFVGEFLCEFFGSPEIATPAVVFQGNVTTDGNIQASPDTTIVFKAGLNVAAATDPAGDKISLPNQSDVPQDAQPSVVQDLASTQPAADESQK